MPIPLADPLQDLADQVRRRQGRPASDWQAQGVPLASWFRSESLPVATLPPACSGPMDLCKERMRRPARPPLLHMGEGRSQILAGQHKTEFVRENRAIVRFSFKGSTFDLTRFVPNVEPRIEERKPSPVRTRARCYQIVEVWALRMRAGEPIADLVFGIEARKQDDAIDVLPLLAELGLQCEFFAHGEKARQLVRGILLGQGCHSQCSGGGQVAKAHVGKEWTLRKIDPQHHVQHGAGRVDLEPAHDARLQASHLVAKRTKPSSNS